MTQAIIVALLGVALGMKIAETIISTPRKDK